MRRRCMIVVDPGLPPWLLPNNLHMSHKVAASPCLHAQAGVLWGPKACRQLQTSIRPLDSAGLGYVPTPPPPSSPPLFI